MSGRFFHGKNVNDYMREIFRKIEAEIETMPVEQLDGDLAGYFSAKHAADVPTLSDDVTMAEPECDLHASRVKIKLHIPFTGDASFFHLQPMHSPLIETTWDLDGAALVVPLTANKSQPETVQRDKDSLIRQINDGLSNVRRDITSHFTQLPQLVKTKVEWRKAQTAAHNQFVKQVSNVIPIRRRNDGAEQIIIPVARKPVP
jgi:hypothetical protein